MSAIAAVFYREGRIRMTNLTFIFWDLFYPLCYMLVFGVGINSALGSPFAAVGVDYNAFFLAGVLAMGRAQYLLGKVLFNVLVALIQAVITVGLGRLLLGIRVRWDLLPLLFAGVAVGTAGWFFFYATFALRTRRNDVFNSVTSIFYFVFLFASSMFYPLEGLPAWFRRAALANPITWEIDWLRWTSIGLGNLRGAAIEGFAFVLFALASFVFAVRSLQQQE